MCLAQGLHRRHSQLKATGITLSWGLCRGLFVKPWTQRKVVPTMIICFRCSFQNLPWDPWLSLFCPLTISCLSVQLWQGRSDLNFISGDGFSVLTKLSICRQYPTEIVTLLHLANGWSTAFLGQLWTIQTAHTLLTPSSPAIWENAANSLDTSCKKQNFHSMSYSFFPFFCFLLNSLDSLPCSLFCLMGDLKSVMILGNSWTLGKLRLLKTYSFTAWNMAPYVYNPRQFHGARKVGAWIASL